MTEQKIILQMTIPGARKGETAEQRLCLSREAYDHIVGRPAKGFSQGYWDKFSTKRKVDMYMADFVKGFGALKYSFAVLDD